MAKGYNPLAPRNPRQLRIQAQRAVSAQISPLIAALNADFDRRSRSGMASLQGYGQQLQSRLQPLQAQTQANYAQAQSSQAAVDASLQQSLSGAGSSLAQGLSAKLGAAGIPVSTDLAAMGQGAGNAGYARGSASLSQLLSQGAAASNYAGQLPGYAALGTQQGINRYSTQLESERANQLGALRSRIPGLVSGELNSLQNLEFQKAAANLGFGEKQQQLQAQTGYQQQRLALTKRGQDLTNQRAQQSQQQKQQKAQASASQKREKAFFSVRDKTFSEAKRLYKGTTQKTAATGLTPGGTQTVQVPYSQAYRNLWSHYGTQLVNQYGYKRKAVDTMIRRALHTAGYPAPGAQKKAAAAGAAGAASAVGSIGL